MMSSERPDFSMGKTFKSFSDKLIELYESKFDSVVLEGAALVLDEELSLAESVVDDDDCEVDEVSDDDDDDDEAPVVDELSLE